MEDISTSSMSNIMNIMVYIKLEMWMLRSCVDYNHAILNLMV